jgi:hypothetical protein
MYGKQRSRETSGDCLPAPLPLLAGSWRSRDSPKAAREPPLRHKPARSLGVVTCGRVAWPNSPRGSRCGAARPRWTRASLPNSGAPLGLEPAGGDGLTPSTNSRWARGRSLRSSPDAARCRHTSRTPQVTRLHSPHDRRRRAFGGESRAVDQRQRRPRRFAWALIYGERRGATHARPGPPDLGRRYSACGIHPYL